MKQPNKWRETCDPFTLPFKNFKLLEVLGYPHAGNDVFYAKGIYNNEEVNVFIKVARHIDANVKNEIEVLNKIDIKQKPIVIDTDNEKYVVTLEIVGERLSTILKDNINNESFKYMEEYGKTLGELHKISGEFEKVKDRKFFHIPSEDYFEKDDLLDVYNYLVTNNPKEINEVFVHGDFHYANILWNDNHISAILDFELSGIGNKEFDIAWSIIRRPGQKFMKTEEEIDLFLKGYNLVNSYNLEYVKYYMILIYTYFYYVGYDDEEYRNYVYSWITNKTKK